MELLGYIATALMGVSLGLVGAGGSILTVPILVYLFAVPVEIATTSSLFIVGSVAAIGALRSYRVGLVQIRPALLFVVSSFVGVYIARALLLPMIPAEIEFAGFHLKRSLIIMVAFAALMLSASISMIVQKRSSQTKSKPHFFLLLVTGVLIGAITSFIGAGGGFLIIPALVLLLGFQMKAATGTSLMIIAANSYFGFGVSAFQPGFHTDWRLNLSLIAISIVGLFAGARWAGSFDEVRLKKLFGYFVLIMGSFILWNQISKM